MFLCHNHDDTFDSVKYLYMVATQNKKLSEGTLLKKQLFNPTTMADLKYMTG